MASVIWTRAALRSLAEIREYLLGAAPERAEVIVARLVASTRTLIEFPRLGRAVPELKQDAIREIIDRYRIVYSVKDDSVTILRVYHAAMDVEARLRRDRPEL